MTQEMKLLQAAMDGNTAAFEQIVKKYQSLVCAITFSGTGQVDISEELAQETFLSAWKNLRQLTDTSLFRSWLCTIARNILNNYYRRKKTVSLDSAKIADLSVQTENLTDNLIAQEETVMLEQALMQIPAEYREPLVMFYRQEKSTKEVALGLGLNESTVRTRLHRARQMLREEIAVRLEQTLERTAPDTTFTKAVMACIGAGLVAGAAGTVSAAAVTGAAGTGTSAATGIAAAMSTMTAKIVTTAAVAAIAVGGVLTYNHLSQTDPQPIQSNEIAVVSVEKKPVQIPNESPKSDTQNPQEDDDPADIPELSNNKTSGFDTPPAATNNLDTEESANLNIEAAEAIDKDDLTLSEASSVPVQTDDKITVGGFVKSEDGEPIAGVDVQLLWDVMRGMPMLDSESTVTDDDGKWQCRVTGESEDISIRLKHPEYLSRHFDYRPSFDDLLEQSAVLMMMKGLQISGFVHDMQGKPVSNALVMPPNSITSINAVHGIQDSPKTTRTDVNGAFLLKAVGTGLQDIVIDADGYAPAFISVNITPEISTIEIVLDEGSHLTGVVTDINGKPLPEVKVKTDQWNYQYKDGTDDYKLKQFKILRRQTVTDAAGRYTIEHLPSIGEVEIAYVKRPGLLTSYIKNDMAQNQSKNITMYPIPTITGTVIDADSGKPITEFEVGADCAWDPNSTVTCNSSIDKITSPQGYFSKTKSNFTAHELPAPGWVAVKISAKGYHSAHSPWMRIDQEFSPITICLNKTQTVGSTLFYSDGVPVSNADVILIEPSSHVYVSNGQLDENFTDSEYSITQTDPNGYFEISAPASPTKILVLDYDEYLVADTNDLKDNLVLTPWTYVTGTVDIGDDMNSNIIVQIKPEYDPNEQIRWVSRQTTNANGQFEFFYIPAIPQIIRYGSADSTNSLNKGFEINPGPNEELQLQLGD